MTMTDDKHTHLNEGRQNMPPKSMCRIFSLIRKMVCTLQEESRGHGHLHKETRLLVLSQRNYVHKLKRNTKV